MKKLVLLGASLVALNASPVLAQTATPAVAIVSIQYAGDGPELGHMLINKDGKVERKNVLGAASKGRLFTDQIQNARAKVLRQVVVQLYQEGYVLKTSLAHAEIDELIFIKEK